MLKILFKIFRIAYCTLPLHTALCLLLLLTFLLLTSCSNRTVNKTFPAVNDVKVGEKFIVNLPEDHTLGESWKFDEDHHDKTVIETGNAVWHGNEKGIYFNFIATKVGNDTLNFSLNSYNKVTKFSRFVIQVQ